MPDPAVTDTVVDAPAPGSLAALAEANDVRAFNAMREAQLKGEAPAPVPAPVVDPPVADAPGADAAAGDPKPELAPEPAKTDAEREAAEAAAKASEAGKTLNEAKQRKLSRTEQLQADVDDLTWRKHRAREAAEAEEARVVALRAEAQRLQQPPKVEAKAFDPGPEPQVGDFADYESFVRAQAKREAKIEAHAATAEAQKAWEARLQAERDQQAQTQAQQANERTVAAHLERVAAAKAKIPDFDAVLDAAKDDKRYDAPPLMVGFIIDSEHGAQLRYELAKLPPDTFRAEYADLPPARMLAALGGLEYQIKSRAAAHPSASPPVRNPVDPAKRPIQPVGTSAPVTAIPSAELAQSDPIAFMRQRDLAEQKRRRGVR